MAESEDILVRVKSASHPSCEDVEFSCNPKATSVRQVKEKIRTLYSFHPDIADQRLIYAGHLLDDVQLLTDVFGLNGNSGSLFSSQTNFQHSGPYTIHLACTSKSYISPNQRSARKDNLSSDSSQSRPFSSQIPNPMMQDPRLGGNMEGHSNTFEMNGNNGIPPEFYALHQLYVEQMAAYMQSWNSAYGMGVGAVGGSGYPFGVPGFVPNQQPFPNLNVPGNNNFVPPPQHAHQPQPPNVPQQNERPVRPQGEENIAAGGGLGGFFGGPAAAAQANDDEENQRDILDWAYTISRLVLILSVVYFYSNFTRFLLVVIFFIAIAMFQRRPAQLPQRQRQVAGAGNPVNVNNQNRNEPAVPNGNVQVQENAVEPGNNNNPNNNNTGEEGNAEAEGTPGVDAATQAAEANIAAGGAQQGFAYYREVTWTFLTTFFTSLIPEMHQHNN